MHIAKFPTDRSATDSLPATCLGPPPVTWLMCVAALLATAAWDSATAGAQPSQPSQPAQPPRPITRQAPAKNLSPPELPETVIQGELPSSDSSARTDDAPIRQSTDSVPPPQQPADINNRPNTSPPAIDSSSPSSTSQSSPVPIAAQSAASSANQSPAATPGEAVPGDEVVTDSGGQAQASSTVGSSITIVSREAIVNSGQTNVADVLRNVVGVDVSRSGGQGQLSSIFLRGANGNQTKVLLDGMPINDPGSAGRAFDFSFMTVDSIERIEVLRGPQSTLYGSDAIGGVINIITVRGSGPSKLTNTAMGGSYETFQSTATLAGGDDKKYYLIGASFFNSDGFSAASRPPGNTEDDGYQNTTISARLGRTLADVLNLDLVVRHTNADTQIDSFDFAAGIPQDSPSSITQNNTFVRGQASAELFDGRLSTRLGGGYSEYNRFSYDPFGGPFYGRQGRLDWRNDLTLFESAGNLLIFSGGGDFTEEQGRNGSIGHRHQNDLGGYAMLRGTVARYVHLTGGMRWDNYTYAGSAVTYRTTGRVDLSQQIAMHAAIGTGFRAPSLSELFDPFVGNTSLRSEASKGWEAGMELRSADNRHVLDGTYFRNDFVNLIQFDFASFLLENVGSARASGLEATYLFRANSRVNHFVNFTVNDTLNRDTLTPLLRRPRYKLSLGSNVMSASGRANLAWSLRFVGDRYDTGGNINPSHWRTDVSGWYQLCKQLRAFARIDNVFNAQYESVYGFGATDFAVYAGLQTSLGG